MVLNVSVGIDIVSLENTERSEWRPPPKANNQAVLHR